MESLPGEMLEMIASFLKFEDILALSESSEALKRICPDYSYTLCKMQDDWFFKYQHHYHWFFELELFRMPEEISLWWWWWW